MWYIAVAGIFIWQFLGHDKYTPLHNFLHAPLLGDHIWELGAAVIVSVIIAAIMTNRTGSFLPGPDYSGFFAALAFAFVGFLWYLVQIHAKPPVTIVRPQPTITVTQAPQSHTLIFLPHMGGWEIVGVVGIIAVVVIAVVALLRTVL